MGRLVLGLVFRMARYPLPVTQAQVAFTIPPVQYCECRRRQALRAQRTTTVSLNIQGQVLAANGAYYDAFARGDLQDLMACWSSSPDIVCIAPLGAPAFGAEAVRRVYRMTFETLQGHEIDFEVLGVSFEDPVATITCREDLCQNGTESTRTEILATNVFVLEEAGWRMVHHHASWRGSTTTRPVAERVHNGD